MCGVCRIPVFMLERDPEPLALVHSHCEEEGGRRRQCVCFTTCYVDKVKLAVKVKD